MDTRGIKSRGTLEVALNAYLHPRHEHCTDEAEKTETVLSAVIYIDIDIDIDAKQINNIFDWSFSLLFSFVQHNWYVALIRRMTECRLPLACIIDQA